MVNFKVSAGALTLRTVNEKDLATLDCHVGDLETFEYVSNRNPALRRQGARAATGSSLAHAMLASSQALNQHALKIWLRRWLQGEAETIRAKLDGEGHDVFIVLANYLSADGPESTTIYTGHAVHFVGSVSDLGSVGEILSHRTLYGPSAKPTPHNDRHSFNAVYLIGSRVGADDTRVVDRLSSLLGDKPDTSVLKRYGL